MVDSLLRFCKRAVHWAWTRDEIEQETSRDRVLFISLMHVTVFVFVLLAGGASFYVGYQTVGIGFWYFGLSFTAFIGTVTIGWELLHYWLDRRLGPPQATPEPDRELAPSWHLSRDTKIGFLVTLLGLVALIGGFQLAQLLAGAIP